MKILLVLIALVGGASAGPKREQRIVGGQETTIEQYPYNAVMLFSWTGNVYSQACGGSFITSFTVLSAAHCYIGDESWQWAVRAGSSYASTGGTLHNAIQLILHPQYDDNMLILDVALVRLSSPVTFGPGVQAISIAGQNFVLFDNDPLIVTGWGTLWSGGPSPEVLQYVRVNVINHELCAQRYAYLKTQPGYQYWPDITIDMFCTGILDVGGADGCQGDSGGPLVYNNYVQYGITSWGYGCGHPSYPGVAHLIPSSVNWIIANA